MTESYPNDVDGNVLRAIAEDGNDMTKPMVVEFHVAAASEQVADLIADAADQLGYETSLFFDEPKDDSETQEQEEAETEPWTCTCAREMILNYDAVMSAQAELDAIAKPLGGYSDGWGTYGNASS